jgi:multidrug efflux pump subunit AcrB
MKQMKIVGALMAVYGLAMLVLLLTPAKQWALEHSVAHLVSRTDRRVGNTVNGAVDMPLAVVGSAAVLFAGLWFALFIPRVFARSQAAMRQQIAAQQPPR